MVEGDLLTLPGVVDTMENLGGEAVAANGLNVLLSRGVTSLNVSMNVELKIGSGVVLIKMLFLIVDGDTLCVLGSKPSSISLNLKSVSKLLLLLKGSGLGLANDRGVGSAGGAGDVPDGPWSRSAANTLDLTRGCLPSGLTSGPGNGVTPDDEGVGDTKLILANWLRSNSTFLLPCFLFCFSFFSNLSLLLLLCANLVFKFALTLGFFPSALINGGLSKGFTIGCSVTSSTTSLSCIKGGTNDLMSSAAGGGGLGLDTGRAVDRCPCL